MRLKFDGSEDIRLDVLISILAEKGLYDEHASYNDRFLEILIV